MTNGEVWNILSGIASRLEDCVDLAADGVDSEEYDLDVEHGSGRGIEGETTREVIEEVIFDLGYFLRDED